jgi:WD40 repeat protein
MSTALACPQCQRPLPADAPHGLCPACLARAACAVGQRVRYVGEYELVDEIARGGMGVVFRARQVTLNRTVALKMILSGGFASPSEVKRFRTEAENAAALDHPHIVPIYEVGEHDGQPYFSMKLIDGPSLAVWLAAGPADRHRKPQHQRAIAQLVAQVARAVHHAHQRGVLHRDLKPGNILLDASAGMPHVTDFGLAKRTEGGATVSRTGSIVGTPAYMAPEQARGEKSVSVAADVWSLGAILYEALTSRVPFSGDTLLDVMRQVAEAEPPAPRSVNPVMHRDLEIICLKCLEKAPGRRYSGAAALADDLERWLRGEPIAARPVGTLERAAKWARRRPAVATMAAALVLVSALAVGGIVWKWLDADNHRRTAEFFSGQLAGAVEDEKRAHGDAELARKLAERRLYGTRVLLAQVALDKLQIGQARRALDATEPALRGWEWRYLDAASDMSRRTLWPKRDVAWGLGYAADAKSLGWVSELAGACWLDVDRPDDVHTADARSGWGHSAASPLSNVAFTADLKYAAIYSARGLALWHTADAKPQPLGPARKPLKTFEPFMAAVAFSADGRRVYAAGEHRLACWDRDQRRELWSMPIDTDQAWSAGVSRDEKLAAVGFDSDKTVHVYDLARKQEVFRTEPHLNAPDRALFTPDGQRLITHCGFGNPRVYDLATNKQILQNTNYWANAFALTNDGKVGALGMSGGYVALFDMATGRDLRNLPGHQGLINTVAFSPDGTLVASAGRDKLIKLWDVPTGRHLRDFMGHAAAVQALAFTPDGRTLASAAADGTLRLWDVSGIPPARQLRFPRPGAVRCWQYLKDNRRLLIGGWWSGNQVIDGLVYLCDAATGKFERAIGPHGNQVYTMSLSTDERWLVTGADDGTMTLWDFPAGTEIRSHFQPLPQDKRFINGAVTYAVSMRPDGSAYAAGLGNGTVVVMDRATGVERWCTQRRSPAAWGEFFGEGKELPMQTNALYYTPDGGHLIAMSSHGDRLLTIYAADTGRVVFESPRLVGEARWALSKDGRYLAFGSDGRGHLFVYDVAQARVVGDVAEMGNVMAIAFAPDGNRLAVSACVRGWDDPSIKLLDWQAGRTIFTARGHESVVSDLAFLPDGSRLVSGSFDHTVKLWDPETGEDLLSLAMGAQTDQRVEHVLIAPDGSRIAATDGFPEAGGGRRDTVLVWWARR